ncbi:S-layer homology domain-containing protein [Sporosarcina quadrami]|nr:S-layer homology domain-containing protein [Sporosarcina quadrami]
MKKPMLSIALAGSLVLSGIIHAVVKADSPIEYSSMQTGWDVPVLITEIMPNSLNVGNSDACEYIELYNNLTVPLPLQDLKLIYGYPDGKSVDWNFVEDKVILPGETMVVWVKNAANSDLTWEDFNQIYGTQLPDSHLSYIESDGMSNTKARSLSVASTSGMVYSKVDYTPEQVIEHKSITYKPSLDGSVMVAYPENTEPTPGTILPEQVPSKPVEQDTESPVISHEPITDAASDQPLFIQAQVTDDRHVQYVGISYQTTIEGPWIQKELTEQADGMYSIEIRPEELISSHFAYRIEASDGQNVTTTEDYQLQLTESGSAPESDFDAQQVPYLLVTELVPDSTNVGKLDGYEFIEIYNNSTEDINLNDYTIRYRYPAEGPGGDLIWRHTVQDLIIPSGETMVFWVINSANGDKTVADFNANYGVNLVENVNIVKIHNGGMANSSTRGVSISTNTGEDISVAYYFDEPDVDDTKPDKGIFYKFPNEAGNKTMVKYSPGIEAATPGSVQSIQVPAVKVQLPHTTEAPIVEDQTSMDDIDDKQNLNLKFSMSGPSVKTVRLYYKTTTEPDYRSIYLTRSSNGIYSHVIYSPELIGNESVNYYLEMSDGRSITKTEIASVNIKTEKTEQNGLNISQGALLKRTALIKTLGSDSSLWIDNEDVTKLTAPSLSGQAYFAFDVKKVNLYFKNGVTIGDEIIHIFDDTINTYETMTIPIEPKYFTAKEATTIAIRSGTKVSPFDQESEENRDDFQIKNVRLVLEDGTTLYDPQYANPEKELLVGDGASATEFFEFAFSVPEEQFKAKAYKWDTTKVANGKHIIEARGQDSTQIDVTVDNEAPTISPSIEDGKEYKGEILIDAAVADEYSGVASVHAQLDGEEIVLPYATTSAILSPGAHKATFIATDKAGNETIKTVNFTVTDESPNEPVAITPKDGTMNIDPSSVSLQVRVTDPTEDPMDVLFFEGHEINAADEQVKIFENSTDVEPPNEMIPAGETAVLQKETMAKVDGIYHETSSTDQFPYQRFEVEVGEAIDETDEIVLNWEGKSLIGRKVSMYTWNNEINKWELRDWKIAKDNQNFKLTGTVKGHTYITDGKVHVMIQDEISTSPEFDYSFIWMSDTQYYSESYPYIYDRMTKWIVEKKEDLNIKYVFHTGDLVDKVDQEIQWNRADEYMKTLEDANVPYGVLAGNHDVGHKTGDYVKYGEYFGEQRYKDQPYYGESYKNNRGHYDLISVNGNDYIMLYMGWGVDDEGIAWLNKVLAENPNRMAFLSFHEYLLVSGNRSPIGDKIYNEVILQNPNVVAVLSGHYHDSELLVDPIDDDGDGIPDRNVYQMLADYQGGPEGGQGFMRLLKVNPIENKIHVQTYSPYLDKYNYYSSEEYPGKDEFKIDLDLKPQEKLVATDFFEAEIFTDNKLGKQKDVAHAGIAETTWNDLTPEKKHGWYVKVSDDFGGQVRSAVWTFVTGKRNGNPDTPIEPNPPVEEEIPSDDQPSDNGNPSIPEIPYVPGKPAPSDKEEVPTKPNDNKQEDQTTENKPVHVSLDMINQNAKQITLQAEQDGDIEWILKEDVLKALKDLKKPIVFQTKSGHSVTMPTNVFASMKGNVMNVQIALATEKIVDNQTVQYADAVDVHVKMDGKPMTIPLAIQLKLNKPIDKGNTTGAAFVNDAWIYAGGYQKDGYWTFPSTEATRVTVMSKQPNFKDTSKHWAKYEIHSLYSRLVIDEKTDKKFAPSAKLTRAEFTVWLSTVFQLPLEDVKGDFADVTASKNQAAQHIEAARRAGIVHGKPNGKFDPDAMITRQQMATMLVRALEAKNPEIVQDDKSKKDFKDDKRISGYAKNAVAKVSAAGLMNGLADGTFQPKRTITRGETAVILWRLLEVKKD